jgi:hypothetical protein
MSHAPDRSPNGAGGSDLEVTLTKPGSSARPQEARHSPALALGEAMNVAIQLDSTRHTTGSAKNGLRPTMDQRGPVSG